eukprot:1035919-Pyramimonas_sp.AAC.1
MRHHPDAPLGSDGEVGVTMLVGCTVTLNLMYWASVFQADRLADALFEEDINRRLNSGLPFQRSDIAYYSLQGLYNNKKKLSAEEQTIVGSEVFAPEAYIRIHAIAASAIFELDKLDAITREELGKSWRTLSYGAVALALFGLSAAGELRVKRPTVRACCQVGGQLLCLNQAYYAVSRGSGRSSHYDPKSHVIISNLPPFLWTG